jgi:hypothetical protein
VQSARQAVARQLDAACGSAVLQSVGRPSWCVNDCASVC